MVHKFALDENSLSEFKRIYSLAGNSLVGLMKQIPYLAALARKYEERAAEDPRKNWTSILKAHALYNSCAVRDPSGSWTEEAFRVQQLYWGSDVTLTYQEQTKITDDLKSALDLIRQDVRKYITNPQADMEKWESRPEELNEMTDDRIYQETETFVKKMQVLSKICNDKMIDFARLCVKRAVTLCGECPCDFAVVSLGSMARGEVTPYSDWEFLFIINEKSAKSVSYFELLAMTCYFIIGNLGETKLKYMNIAELNEWFEDGAKSGFKIDGLQKHAGNIPTGNGLKPIEKNKFIQTPEKLKRMYAKVSAKPKNPDALQGDLTAMLASTALIYGKKNLLDKFESFRREHKPKKRRFLANNQMLEQDLMRYSRFMDDARVMDIKKEIYRYPSLFLFNLKILCQAKSSNSWNLIEELSQENVLHLKLQLSLKFLLAAALYIRLSMYLHYDSQHDRLLLSDKNQAPENRNEWFLPLSLHLQLAMHIRAVQQKEVNIHQANQKILVNVLSDPRWKPIHLEPLRAGIHLYGRLGDLENRIKYVSLAMNMCKSEENIPLWLKIEDIQLLYLSKDFKQAIAHAQHCLKSVEANVDLMVKMQIEMLLSQSYLKDKNYGQAASLARKYSVEFIIESQMDATAKTQTLLAWAGINKQIDRQDEAEAMYVRALERTMVTGHFSLQLECGYQLMKFYNDENTLDKAMQVAPKVLNLISMANFYADGDMAEKGMWAHHVLLSGYENKESSENLREALKHGYLSIDYQRRISQDLNLATDTLRILAEIHMRLEEYDHALLLLKNACKVIQAKTRLLPESSDWDELQLCKTDMTNCLLLSGQVELAATPYIEAMTAQFMAEMASTANSELARSVICSIEINMMTDENSNEICPQ